MMQTEQTNMIAEPAPVYPVTTHALGDLVSEWAKCGAALPVAVIVSLFDDLLASLSDSGIGGTGVKLDDIAIDETGYARFRGPIAPSSGELGELLRIALSGGAGECGIPFSALRVLGAVSFDEQLSPDHVRRLLREALGSPATRDEVRECLEVLRQSVRPASDEVLPTPELVDEAISGMFGGNASEALSGEVPLSFLSAIAEDDEPAAEVVADAPASPTSTFDRLSDPPSLLPRVRISSKRRRPVSLPAAPPARLGSTTTGFDESQSSIRVPYERSGKIWLGAISVVGGALLVAYAMGWIG